jgi:predicted Zn-dependent protease
VGVARARFFDGRTSRPHAVEVRAVAGELAIEGDNVSLRLPLAAVRVGEPLERAPRLLALPGGARCEIEPGPALDLLLGVLGHREGRLSRWQRRWTIAAVSAVVTLAVLLAGYRFGLPWAADTAARALPEESARLFGAHVLATLDGAVFDETRLDAGRRERLAGRLAALRAPGGELPEHSLHFRHAPSLGANAFALPGGEIVLTDALVELAASEDELLGVVAHELGHLRERHALRRLIQSSAVGFVVAMWLGDVTALGTGLPAAVLEAKYSRDFEREADAFAAEVLRANGLDTRPLADLLDRLEASQGGEGGAVLGYLASHPASAKRRRALAVPMRPPD